MEGRFFKMRFKIWIKQYLSAWIYHSLPQDQTPSGASVNLQFNGLW